MVITVDIDSLTSQFDISKNQIDALLDYVVKDITASYVRKLEHEAESALHGTRNRYLSSIKVLDTGRFKGAVLLDYSKDKLIKMLEEGAQPFDIKKGFESSSKRITKKDGKGWYLTIPFREANPNAVGESSIFSSILPQEVYKALQKKEEINVGGQYKTEGLKLDEIPKGFQKRKTRQTVTNFKTHVTFDAYKNKSSIYEGITKLKDTVTGQNIYMSFRRVSDKSDPNSWIHTGITAYNLMDKAMSNIESNMEAELNSSTNRALSIMGF